VNLNETSVSAIIWTNRVSKTALLEFKVRIGQKFVAYKRVGDAVILEPLTGFTLGLRVGYLPNVVTEQIVRYDVSVVGACVSQAVIILQHVVQFTNTSVETTSSNH
jgi:hypothetical protein